MLLHLVLVVVFGILIPWWKGVDFFDPAIISAYACVGILFAAPAAAQAFSPSRPQSMREACLRAGRAALYGEGLALIFLAAGTLTVSLSRARLLLPEVDVLGSAVLLGVTGSVAFALLAGWMTLRFSAQTARTAMRIIFILLLVAFFYYGRRLPDVTLTGAGLCVMVAAAGLFLLWKEVSPR